MTDQAEKDFVSDHNTILEARDAFNNGRWPDGLELIEKFIRWKFKADAAQQHEWAMSFIRRRCRWFRDRLTEEALGRWKGGEFKDMGEFHEFVRDRASELLSHLNDARLYLAVSDSSDAVVEEDVEFTNSRGVDWCVAATYALVADALLDLQSENVSGEPPQEPSTYCAQCEKWRPDVQWVEGDDICSQCAEDSM